jgi:hypothetical protein
MGDEAALLTVRLFDVEFVVEVCVLLAELVFGPCRPYGL